MNTKLPSKVQSLSSKNSDKFSDIRELTRGWGEDEQQLK